TLAQERLAAARLCRLRPDRARPAPGPYCPAAEDEALPGPGAHGHLPDRRLHRHDRRPTGRNVTRPPLSDAEITRNARTYLEQVFKILSPVKTEIRRNSEWFSKFSAADFVRLSAKYTVSQMLEREDFHQRFQ